MEFKKSIDRFGYPAYTLQEDKTILRIWFGNNGDIYFGIDNLDKEEPSNYEIFCITKENYDLYRLFEKLYDDIASPRDPEPYKVNTMLDSYFLVERQFNLALFTKSQRYKELFDGKKITWISDDGDFDKISLVQISKIDDTIVLEFARSDKLDKKKNPYNYLQDDNLGITIRFRNVGSRYAPFDIPFMELYNSLGEYEHNPKYHQIHIEEYLYSLKKK